MKNKKYRVHVFMVVRVPFEIEATSKQAAIEAVKSQIRSDSFRRDAAEDTEDVSHYLVDELDAEGGCNEDQLDFVADYNFLTTVSQLCEWPTDLPGEKACEVQEKFGFKNRGVDEEPKPTISVAEFRREIKACYPHVKLHVRKVSFDDLARASKLCLTVTGDRPGEIYDINRLAALAGILPDTNLRVLTSKP